MAAEDQEEYLDLRGVESLLSLHEKPQFVIYEHWYAIWKPLAAALVMPLVVLLFLFNAPANSGGGFKLLLAITALVWAWAYFQWLDWHSRRVIVTDRRLIKVSGIVTLKKAMMPLTKVTDMNYSQSIMGRTLRFGTFSVESAGQSQALSTIDFVPHSDYYYHLISTLIFDKEADPAQDEQAWQPWDESEEWQWDEAGHYPQDHQRWGRPADHQAYDHASPHEWGGQGWTPGANGWYERAHPGQRLWEATGEMPVYDPDLDPYRMPGQRTGWGPRRWAEEYRARHRE